MYFLCDTIDLRRSVEGTLKVQGKFLTTVLDEVHFIVNLYSFPLPLVSQTNASFPKVIHFSTSQAEQLPKLSYSFCSVNPSFLEDISTPRLESTKWQTVLITTLALQAQPQEYIPSYFHTLPRTLFLSSEFLLSFLSKFFILSCGKNF